ncbi:RhuM family protein [Veillonella sp.]|uniref:RhuM family protein n=1 Tax=Veillonella sp. TaxID=1926307 RepID=UPI0025F93A0C|nr:RhuM family protein [Veillonella sp.]
MFFPFPDGLHPQGDVIIYQSNDTNITTNVLFKNETFWMPQKDIAQLFNVERSTISRHLQNIFNEHELDKSVVCAEIAHTTKHGAIDEKTQTKNVTYYNLDAIIAVGYRVNSKEATHFINAIRAVLVKCSQPVSEYNPDTDIVLRDILLDFRGKSEVVVLEYENGTQIPFTELPTGYLRFFSMVFDIACRGYLLNKDCNPDGVVLVDELDLHLHPSVERTILKRLRTTFTRVQWIVSTHSPLVLSAFEQKDGSNVIYKISKEKDDVVLVPVANMQGVDASTGLKYTMDTPDDDSRLNDYKEAYDFWKAKGDAEKVANLKEMIKNIVGENSLFFQMLK